MSFPWTELALDCAQLCMVITEGTVVHAGGLMVTLERRTGVKSSLCLSRGHLLSIPRQLWSFSFHSSLTISEFRGKVTSQGLSPEPPVHPRDSGTGFTWICYKMVLYSFPQVIVNTIRFINTSKAQALPLLYAL